jgi:polyisoprenoid-binding protein YceI
MSTAALLVAAFCLFQPPDNLGTPFIEPTPPAPTVARAPSGKSLVVADAHRALGTVYHCAPSTAKQVSFSSVALNAKFDGHSSGVIGYAIAGPEENPAALRAGVWAMPVKSLDSGNKLRDKHTAGPDWLDAANHPDLTFVLTEVRDAKLHKESAAGKSYTATLVGDMTIHGVTRQITIPETVLAFAAGSEKSALKGNLLAIRCKYTVKLSDYGISNDYTTTLKSVADEIGIDQSLVMSTVAPEDQPAAETAR